MSNLIVSFTPCRVADAVRVMRTGMMCMCMAYTNEATRA